MKLKAGFPTPNQDRRGVASREVEDRDMARAARPHYPPGFMLEEV
ncbi:MAG: hypothetical protein NTU59_06825 [Coprothermobacterota bacterium]|nr:hypothetical protein [Coprothermobacterota bacterium]